MATKTKGPKAPEPRSLADEMRQLQEAQANSAAAQAESTLSTNQGLIDQGFAAQARQAKLLNNSYTTEARGGIRSSLRDSEFLRSLGINIDTGETEIEARLKSSALSELDMGGALTPEEIRQSEQGSRSAFAARGMALSNPAAISEVLNRMSLSDARLGARREFAGGVNNMLTQNTGARIGQAGGLVGNAGSLSQAAANGMVSIDPRQRAMGSALPTAFASTAAGVAGNAYNGMLGYGSDLFNTNLNLQGNLYNSYQNNQAALRGANMQVGAAGAAGKNAMLGGGMAAAGTVIGAVGGVAIAI